MIHIGLHIVPIVCLLTVAVALGDGPAPVTTQAATKLADWPAGKPTVPADLPGNGLAQHDFFYAGEAKTRDMYIVRKGKIAWAYHNSDGRGEISDAALLPNGNVLFAHQFAVTLIDADQKVIWNHDAPPKCEIHTAQMLGSDRIVFIVNGPDPKAVVMNITTNTVEKELPLTVKKPNSTHGQFRHACLTEAGTLLVTHMDSSKVAEYDETGKEVWSVIAPGCWSAERLKNGNTLITCNREVREVNPAGEIVWRFTPEDMPDYKVSQFQIARRLSNGNTLVNNWVNQWNGPIDPAAAPAQAWEVTPDKKIVWVLHAWTSPDLGPATTIQLLDEPAAPSATHFGSIK